MNEAELEYLVLEKTKEMCIVATSLGDENKIDDGLISSNVYFIGLDDFYRRPQDRKDRLQIFKKIYFKELEDKVINYEGALAHYDISQKTIIKMFIADAVFGAGFLGGYFFHHWGWIIPLPFVVFAASKLHDTLEKVKEAKKKTIPEFEEFKKEKEEKDALDSSGILDQMLERILLNKKDKIMEYYQLAMAESDQ